MYKPNTLRALMQRTVLAVVATGMLSACPAPEEDDAKDGDGDDTDLVDGATPRDGAVGKDDGGSRDGGVTMDGSLDGGSRDGEVVEQPDAYVPVNPSMPGEDKPTLDKLAYYYDVDMGARVVLRGQDPNGDVTSYTVKFFKDGSPVYYDLDNDPETPTVNQFTKLISTNPLEKGFVVTFEPTLELVEAVDEVRVFVSDEGSRHSNELNAPRTTTPLVAGSCDPDGFNRCNNGGVCVKSGFNHVCSAVSSARTSACNTALTLQPPQVDSVRGQLRTYSLWDIPPSCGNDVIMQSDAVVKLKLTSPASRVVLSTESPHTDFDTVLYLLDNGCKAAPTTCAEDTCFCSDDIPETASTPRSTKSRLTLTDLKAGDYYIVVDSAYSSVKQGDLFELKVMVQ